MWQHLAFYLFSLPKNRLYNRIIYKKNSSMYRFATYSICYLYVQRNIQKIIDVSLLETLNASFTRPCLQNRRASFFRKLLNRLFSNCLYIFNYVRIESTYLELSEMFKFIILLPFIWKERELILRRKKRSFSLTPFCWFSTVRKIDISERYFETIIFLIFLYAYTINMLRCKSIRWKMFQRKIPECSLSFSCV